MKRPDERPTPASVTEHLKTLREDPPEDDFAQRLHLRLAHSPPPHPVGLVDHLRRLPDLLRSHPGATGAALGSACTALVFGLLLLARGSTELGPSRGVARALPSDLPKVAAPPANEGPSLGAVEEHALPVDRIALVQIHIESRTVVEDARVRIELPPGLAFYDRAEEERGFTLVTRLDRGETPIPIAVRPLEEGVHAVEASTIIEGREVRHRVLLEVQGEAG